MAWTRPIIHYPALKTTDGAGGTLKVPDRANGSTFKANITSQSDVEATLEVPTRQPILIGDFLRVPHDAFLRS